MCYSMFGKRSDAAKKGIDTSIPARSETEMTAKPGEAMTSERLADEKAYTGFKRRVQHWMGRDEQKEKEFTP